MPISLSVETLYAYRCTFGVVLRFCIHEKMSAAIKPDAAAIATFFKSCSVNFISLYRRHHHKEKSGYPLWFHSQQHLMTETIHQMGSWRPSPPGIFLAVNHKPVAVVAVAGVAAIRKPHQPGR